MGAQITDKLGTAISAVPQQADETLEIEIVLDLDSPSSNLVAVLADLVLDRARRVVSPGA